jgi:aminoglycoside phosphotransferase (APT) family kinase protein
MSGVVVAPAVRDLSVLAAQLADWLGRRIPGAKSVRVVNLAYPLGAGQSHETILFDAIWNQAGGDRRRGLVIRIKPTRFTVFQDDMFDEQYRLMRVLHESGRVRVAEPLWFEPEPSLLGAPFFVMEKLVGRVAVSIPPYGQEGWVVDATPAQRAAMWEDGVRQLAAIQSVPLSSVQFLARPEAGPEGFDQEMDRWRRYLNWISEGRSWPFLEAAWVRLVERSPVNRPAGIVWGDARIGNTLVGDDFRVRAVMDWEQTSLGGALHDLGWWLYSDHMHSTGRGLRPLAGFGARADTIELWHEVSGISTGDIEWYEAFAGFKMACLSVRMQLLRGEEIPRGDYPDTPANREVARRLEMPWP